MATDIELRDININELMLELDKESVDVIIRNFNIMDMVKIVLKSRNIQFNNLKPSQAIYLVKNNATHRPVCQNCGSLNIEYYDNGEYAKHCSSKCGGANKNTIEKRKETNQQKYGVDNVSKSPLIIEKIKNTTLQKYGKPYYSQTDEYKKRLDKKEICPIIDYEKQSVSIKTLFYNKLCERTDVKPQFSLDEYLLYGHKIPYKWECQKCKHVFESITHRSNFPYCPSCNPRTDIENFLTKLLTKWCIPVKHGDRKSITPLEIDFLIESKKIGIEANGLYWHSENSGGKDKNYHVNKTELCYNNGIRLIQIFADEIEKKPKIVEHRLKYILGLVKNKIYARKCELKEIDSTLKGKFLNKYHIQGNDKSIINIGAFYKNHLVAVMTFSNLRKVTGLSTVQDHYELSRYATVFNFVITGICNKILKYFENKYNPKKIISYCDRRWNTGKSYENMGFIFKKNTAPNYWYTNDFHERIHRFNFQKHLLKEKLLIYDENKSERELMIMNKYDRIWDCGSKLYEKCYGIEILNAKI
jgi:hypothetical protein